jgi:hypothetical protein
MKKFIALSLLASLMLATVVSASLFPIFKHRQKCGAVASPSRCPIQSTMVTAPAAPRVAPAPLPTRAFVPGDPFKGDAVSWVECPHCKGRGLMPDASKDYGWSRCEVCAGTGKVAVKVSVDKN